MVKDFIYVTSEPTVIISVTISLNFTLLLLKILPHFHFKPFTASKDYNILNKKKNCMKGLQHCFKEKYLSGI